MKRMIIALRRRHSCVVVGDKLLFVNSNQSFILGCSSSPRHVHPADAGVTRAIPALPYSVALLPDSVSCGSA